MLHTQDDNLRAQRAWNTNARFWDERMADGNDFFTVLIGLSVRSWGQVSRRVWSSTLLWSAPFLRRIPAAPPRFRGMAGSARFRQSWSDE